MVRLGDIIEQIRGVSYKPEDVYAELTDESVAILRANNIKDGRLDFQNIIYVNKRRVKDNQYLRTGDILVCTSNGSKDLVGKAAYVESDLPMAFGAFCKVVRPTLKFPKYLGHFFDSPYYRKKISDTSAGANINNIRNEHIDEIEIQLPPIGTQQHIISILDTINCLIALRKQQLKKLDELVKARFVEMFGDVQMNPYDFEKLTMADVAEELFAGGDKPIDISDQQDEQHPYPVYANGEINNGLQGYAATYRVSDDAVTVAARGTIGFCCIRKAHFTPVVRLITIVPKKQINIVYLAYAIRLVRFKSSGTSQAQLTVPDFKNIPILAPPLEFQEQFADFVGHVVKSRLTIQQGLDKLELMKSALMQEYFG